MKLLRIFFAVLFCLKLLPATAAELEFSVTQEHGLYVAMHTERLIIRSFEAKDLESVVAIFTDPVVMAKFATGVRTHEASIARFQTLYDRWQAMNPYTALAVTLADDPENFIGIIALSAGDDPGQAELSFLLFAPYWNQGFGKEAATAIVQDYAPWLIANGFGPEGHPLRQIVATARVDNPASFKILEGIGMSYLGTSERHGFERRHYFLNY